MLNLDAQIEEAWDVAGTEELTVSQAVRARRSRRVFAERDVEEEKLQIMLQAARWAASRGNSQPWRWVVARNEPALSELHKALSPSNQWASKAPVMLAIATNPEEDTFKDGRMHYIMDCGQSVGQFLLQGAALGLMMHVLAGWDEAGVKQALGIPEPVRVLALIAAGYMGNPDLLDEETRSKDLQPKPRHPTSRTIFLDRWQKPYPLDE
jgi:nitroreductase